MLWVLDFVSCVCCSVQIDIWMQNLLLGNYYMYLRSVVTCIYHYHFLILISLMKIISHLSIGICQNLDLACWFLSYCFTYSPFPHISCILAMLSTMKYQRNFFILFRSILHQCTTINLLVDILIISYWHSSCDVSFLVLLIPQTATAESEYRWMYTFKKHPSSSVGRFQFSHVLANSANG